MCNSALYSRVALPIATQQNETTSFELGRAPLKSSDSQYTEISLVPADGERIDEQSTNQYQQLVLSNGESNEPNYAQSSLATE